MKSASLRQTPFPIDKGDEGEALLVTRALLGVIAIVFLFRIYLVFNLNINWDEFFYLSHIYAYDRGDLSTPIQTIYVHIFYWLTFLPFTEIGQVVTGRIVMLCLFAASAVLLYRITSQHFSRVASLACVLLYVAFSNTLSHGASFRADPMCAFLFLASVALFLDVGHRRWALVLVGGLMAFAFMISIKSALYALFWAVLLGWRLQEAPARTARQAFLMAISFALFVACFYGLHLVLLEMSARSNGIEGWQTGNALASMAGSGQKALLSAGFFPRPASFIQSLSQNMLAWILIASGGLVAAGRLLRGFRS